MRLGLPIFCDLIAHSVGIGTRLQGRVSGHAARLFFVGLFAAIGVSFLLAFTVFIRLFG